MPSTSESTIVPIDEPDGSLDSSTTSPMKKTDKTAFRERLKRIPKPSIVSHRLLYGLHILLIFMHIVLLIIDHYGIAGSVKVKLGQATTILSISLSIGSQTFAIVYLTILLYITQRLALRRILYSQAKTITSIHDRQTAWSGLGSAINSCWNQLSVSASVWGVGIITVYLTLMAGLKITTPSLLGLASVPQNNTANVDSKLNDPFPLASLQVSPPARVYGGSHTIRRHINFGEPDPIDSSASIVRLLQQLKSQDSGFGSGLLENMLYDVLKNNSGVGTAWVNSYMMNVSCGAPPPQYPSNVTKNATSGEYVIKDEGLTIPSIAPNVLSIDLGDFIWPLFRTSFNVVDSTGKLAPQVLLNPPMNPFDYITLHNDSDDSDLSTTPWNPAIIHALNMSAIYNFNVSSMSAFSCFLTVSTSPIPWLLSMMSGSSTNVSSSDLCGVQPYPQSFGGGVTLNLPACQYLSQAESFILDAISVSPSTNQSWLWDNPILSDNAPSIKIARVPLHELEKAIEDYTAQLFWSALYLSDLRNTGEVQVSMIGIVSELQINLLPVIAGLVLSILLLIIAPALVGWKPNGRYKASVDNLGVLEILWLDGSREITHVQDPSTGNLRRAGMFASADLSSRRRWVD
ncbi:hypothetical protein C8J56DRAFT_1037836 [Mycena floridula]|nr:hypothetical protein C8J56DRAFT_1037836 [Mycena floridula]